MILKAVVGFVKFIIMNLDITNVAIIFLIKRIVTHNTNTVNADAIGLNIILSQQLETAADS